MDKSKVLSNDFVVCRTIYEFSEIKGEKVWYSKLTKILDGSISPATISRSLDKLFDLGMIDGNWEKVDAHWARTFKITGEVKGFIKSIYELTSSEDI